MATRELRGEARIPVTQRGNLGTGSEWFPCMVLDVSNSGFLMMSNKQLPVGQTLEFRCELYPGKVLECMVEVMHSTGDSAGMMITEIDDGSTKLLHTYIEEKYAVKLSTIKARRSDDQ